MVTRNLNVTCVERVVEMLAKNYSTVDVEVLDDRCGIKTHLSFSSHEVVISRFTDEGCFISMEMKQFKKIKIEKRKWSNDEEGFVLSIDDTDYFFE